MTASNIPNEILTKIADYLSTKDRLSCALTCKEWRYPFQRVLWRNIRITTIEAAKRLVATIQESQRESISLGLSVQSLNIPIYCNMEGVQDTDILMYLPNLRHLDLGNVSYVDIYTKTTRSYSVWKSLESLKFVSNKREWIRPGKNLLEFVNTCCRLQELEISASPFNHRIEFSVNDFDVMHQNLRQLSSIKVDMYLNPDFSSALGKIPDTRPAFGVKSLNINSKKYVSRYEYTNQWNPLWLYYFGYKYPNVHTLKIDATETCHNPITSDQKQKIISLFQSNPNAFKHLETFHFANDRYFESSDFFLWDVLWALRVPLKHLDLDATVNQGADHSHTMDIDRILQSFSRTLETLSLKGFIYFESSLNPKLRLSSYYPLLTYLCISGHIVSIDLDDLLDRCVALKQLGFSGEELFVTPRTIDNKPKQHHALQILTLFECTTSAKVFRRLSFRCRKLRYMALGSLWITGSISKKTGRLFIDMPYTLLQDLHIDQVQYITSNQEFDITKAINMTHLTQLYDPILADELNERKRKEAADPKAPTMISHTICWVYTYGYFVTSRYHRQGTYELLEEEGDYAQQYFQDFKPKKTGIKLRDGSYFDEDEPETFWEYELFKGYGEFRFGKVADYITGGIYPPGNYDD
ncbi:hypothetical protein F4703DRAFT_1937615 [Phycomyces blakesleeanus]